MIWVKSAKKGRSGTHKGRAGIITEASIAFAMSVRVGCRDGTSILEPVASTSALAQSNDGDIESRRMF